MKQLILVGNQKVKFQDTETTISLTLVSDGNTVTIDSTKTYSVKIKNGTGYVKAITATPDTTNNMVTFSTAGFDGLPVDAYFIELWVIDTKGQTIYPSDSFIELDITANATGVQGQVVPAITLQEFEDRFSTLQSDLEAKVSTLIGPTGATGNGISGVTTQYQLGTDGDKLPTGTWSDNPSTPTDTLPYMWTRNVTTYTDGSTHTSYNISAKGTQGNNFTIQGSTSSVAGLPNIGTDGEGYMVGTELYVWTNGKWNDIVNMKGVQGDKGIQGIQGVKGDTGNGIQSTSTDYQLSSQGVEVPNTGWSTTIPATTNALPYLWTRVTITFTDSSQHVIYFTSNKGDKGDKGDTGEKGDTGANLAVKGALDKSTSLPSTGNSEGDAYLVGTDLYVYTKGTWKNCGPIVAENTVLYNADGSLNVNGTNFNYVQDLRNGKIQYNDGTKNVQVTPMDADKEASDILAARTYTDTSVSALSTSVDTKLSTKANAADLSTGLATKVTDNKDNTIQVNGTQVNPYNKLTDTIGGRNLLLGTSSTEVINSTWNNAFYVDVTKLIGMTLTYSCILDITLATRGTVVVSLAAQDSSGNAVGSSSASNTITHGNSGRVIATITIPTGASKLRISERTNNTDANPYVGSRQLEKGSIATDWTPAPEDKVNVSDMRKPASDVAGIEEVNTKQDKIGYTPADDSKVVHATDTSSWQKSKVTDDAGMPLLMLGDTDDLSAKIAGLPNGYFTIYCTGKTLNNPSASPKRGIIHITASTRAGSGILFSEDKNAYIITMLLGTVTYTKMADDSKVSHLSGANNFDTVPTVNNNPLLLASSLPSTLADTTKDTNFTGNLQKSGIDVATTTDVTNAVSTATANMVDSTKATNFTAGLKSGGVYVATAADLKSIEASAWRQLDNKYITPASGYTLAPSTNILYRIDDSIHTLYLSGSIVLTSSGIHNVTVTVQLGSIIKSILTLSVPYFGYYSANNMWEFVHASQSSTNLTFLPVSGVAGITATSGTEGKLAFVTYDELV